MILTCPSCGTKFRIPDDALGDTGRKLRCAACKHVWFETPAPPETAETFAPTIVEETPPPPCAPDAAPAQSDLQDQPDTTSDADQTAEEATPPVDAQPSAVYAEQDTEVLAPEREPEPEVSDNDNHTGLASDTIKPKQRDGEARTEPTFDISRVVAPDAAPEEKPRKKRRSGAKAFLLFLLLIVAVGYGLYELRNHIMRNIPATIDYYEMAGLVGPPNSFNLEYRDEGLSVEVQGDHSLLVVSGRIVNTGSQFQRLPELRAEILDITGAVVLDWSFKAAAVGLGPGDQTTYRATYPDPPRGDDLFEILMTFEDVR
jgi:predicted Zn finger-like uncharacterized protein